MNEFYYSCTVDNCLTCRDNDVATVEGDGPDESLEDLIRRVVADELGRHSERVSVPPDHPAWAFEEPRIVDIEYTD